MASTYVNDLRLNELATGDASGTWGTITNTNLELIAEAFSFGTESITTNADTHTSTIADGATDPVRSMYVKYTGTLDSACTITIAPNTVSKLWFIENGTSGSQNIIISQGTGANVTIPAGDTKVVYSDGAGSGAAIVDAFASLSTVDLKVQDDLTVTDDASVGGDLLVSGEVQTANIGFTDGDNAITIADGGGITAANGITSTAAANTLGATSFNDANITNVGDIALDSLSADGSSISIASPVVINGSTPTLTIGDAGAEDTALVFDGNAKDFYVGLDDSADVLVIGEGSTVGTNNILTITDDSVTIGDGAAVDTKLVFDGNAQDFYIGLDDSADDLIIGVGSTVGTTPALTINDGQTVTAATLVATGSFTSPGIDDNADAIALTITSSEQVGIGTATSPSGLLHLRKDSSETNLIVQSNTGGSGSSIGGRLRLQLGAQSNTGSGAADTQAGDTLGQIMFEGQGTDFAYQGANIKCLVQTGDGDDGRSNQGTLVSFETIAVGSVSPAERLRIDQDGNLLLNTTDKTGGGQLGTSRFALKINGAADNGILVHDTRTSSGTDNALVFVRGSSTVGSIQTSTSATAFNTSSDYRLKENIQPMENGLERLNKLKPSKFIWKETGESSEGFIAHEVQEAGWLEGVSGNKDDEQMQMVDYGKITPLLVKAIQEQQAQIEALQAEINTLKGE